MASYQATVLSFSPYIYWRFSETSGASCADSSANGFTGTANGTFTRNVSTGHAGLGVGITLGGAATDYVAVNSAGALNNLGDVTYMCWVNPTTLPARSVLVAKGNADAANGGYEMYLDAAGHVAIAICEIAQIAISTGTVGTGAWHHVAATRVLSSQAYAFYIDGVSAGSGVGTNNAPASTAKQFTAGVADTIASKVWPLNGSIDEVAAFGTALSSANIAAIYAARDVATDGTGKQSSPGQIMSAIVQARNEERKAARGEPRFPSRHPEGYQRRKGRP